VKNNSAQKLGPK